MNNESLDVISKLVEIEKMAKSITDDSVKMKAQLNEKIKAEIEEITKALSAAEEEIYKNTADSLVKETDTALQEAESKMKAAIAELEKIGAESSDTWALKTFEKIVK